MSDKISIADVIRGKLGNKPVDSFGKPVVVVPSFLVEVARDHYGSSVTVIDQASTISQYDRHLMNRKPPRR